MFANGSSGQGQDYNKLSGTKGIISGGQWWSRYTPSVLRISPGRTMWELTFGAEQGIFVNWIMLIV